MAANNRIKDFLEPFVYEYYKEHRNKFKYYASDLEALRAQLLYAMSKEHKYPERTNKWDYHMESKCSNWLSWMLRESKDFDGFCSFFWEELKGLKRQTPDFYDKCQWILDNYGDEAVRDVYEKNKSRKENAIINRFERKHKKNGACINKCYPKQVQNVRVNNDKYSYHIEKERSYGGYATIPYIVTKHCRENVYSIQKWDYKRNIERTLHITWEKFLEEYSDYISGIDEHSIDFKYQCYAIILEYKAVEGGNPTLSEELKTNQLAIDKNKAIKIEEYVTERIMDNRSIMFVNVNGMWLMPPENKLIARECERWAEDHFGIYAELDDFAKHFASELSLYRPYTDKWYLTCFKLCREHNKSKNLKNTDEITFSWFIKLTAGLIASFFVFGGIAYVFKHLIALVIYFIGYILWCICNIINSIGAILFNYDVETLPLETDDIPDQLQIWQIGGWCYGTIVACVILWMFFTLLDKWSNKYTK